MEPEFIYILAGIVTIFLGIAAVLKWGNLWLIRLRRVVRRDADAIPKRTLRVVPKSRRCGWTDGTDHGEPSTQISVHLYVTNITRLPIQILNVFLRKTRLEGIISLRHPEFDIYGSYPIMPGDTTEAHALLWVKPPLTEDKNEFKLSLILVDQFGNEHKLKSFTIYRLREKETKKKEMTRESIRFIESQVEKDVASILKAEVDRYKVCGRPVGGFGSFQTTIEGHKYTGVGTEWKEPNSPVNQLIMLDEERVTIESDNALALINVFSKQSEVVDRKLFFHSIMVRIDRTTEYAPVGYMSLYVCHELGCPKEVLLKAKRDLRGDNGWGYSDLLRFLDAMLRFRHSSFTIEILEVIEQIVEDETEHVYSIPERIAAIRAYRLTL